MLGLFPQLVLAVQLSVALRWLEQLRCVWAWAGRFENRDSGGPSLREAHLVLRLAEDASPESIKTAYRALAMKYHPDRGGSEEAMKRLNGAYARLMKQRSV